MRGERTTFQSPCLSQLALGCLRSPLSLGKDNPAQGQNAWSWAASHCCSESGNQQEYGGSESITSGPRHPQHPTATGSTLTDSLDLLRSSAGHLLQFLGPFVVLLTFVGIYPFSPQQVNLSLPGDAFPAPHPNPDGWDHTPVQAVMAPLGPQLGVQVLPHLQVQRGHLLITKSRVPSEFVCHAGVWFPLGKGSPCQQPRLVVTEQH